MRILLFWNENLLRILLGSVLLHDPLRAHPSLLEVSFPGEAREEWREVQSRGIKRDKLNGGNGAKVAIFRWFLLFLGSTAFRRCKFSHKTAETFTENRRILWNFDRGILQKPICPMYRKNPHAHKHKIGISTPPSKKKTNHPPKRGILWAWGFTSRKNQKCQAPIKSAQPFPALELRVEKLRTRAFFFLNLGNIYFHSSGPLL